MYNFPIHQPQTGYRVQFHPGEHNHCPGCGRSHWHVGRLTAECAYCATALPIAGATSSGAGVMRRSAA